VLPNGSRLSCGALKKDSFHNLRAPPNFKRLLGGTSIINGSSLVGRINIDLPRGDPVGDCLLGRTIVFASHGLGELSAQEQTDPDKPGRVTEGGCNDPANAD
jgi:hypothetical protein